MSVDESLEHLPELQSKAGEFPRSPGVYLMKDEAGTTIYVGKAKDLRARVKTYFLGGDGRRQIEFLMRRVRQIDHIVTATEEQAFILERDLITKFKPRYNIRLKDDKAYLSIRIDENRPWPRIELVRRVENDGARYFGPYTFSYEMKGVIEVIKRVVPLRTCTNTVFFNRQRPCLEYQIKRCAGPCCLPVEPELYREWVKQAIAILEGKTDATMAKLVTDMERASEQLRFEDAAVLRDRIDVLDRFVKGQHFPSHRGESRDAFGFTREDSRAAVCVLRIKSGRISDSITFSLTDVRVSDEELIEAAVEQFYEGGRDIPEEVVLPVDLENESIVRAGLKGRAGRVVEVLTAKRGPKHRLVQLATVNARQHYSTTFDAESRYQEVAQRLARVLGLRQIPRRIECVDISNFQGSDIVGAIVSFFDGAADKSRYRKYTISKQDKPDDFAAIHEVVTRRLTRGLEDVDLPDLLIIDGGAGQLKMALEARDALRLDLEIVALAKMRTEHGRRSADRKIKPERFFTEREGEPILLESSDEVTHLVQRIRDEVHRFVITFHRSRRAKRVFRSLLDEIPGIGPERRQRLLREFGSVSAMADAEPAALAKAGRMPLSLAMKVLAALEDLEGRPQKNSTGDDSTT